MFTCCGANHSNHTTAFKRDAESMRVLFGWKVGFEDRFQHQHFVRRSLVSTPTFSKPLHCLTHCATMSSSSPGDGEVLSRLGVAEFFANPRQRNRFRYQKFNFAIRARASEGPQYAANWWSPMHRTGCRRRSRCYRRASQNLPRAPRRRRALSSTPHR